MGCDIHLFVEKEIDGDWLPIKEPVPRIDHYDDWYGARNYNVFAVLADVRNGHGFAGVNTGDGFVPISAPRGLPTDVSQEIQEESDEFGVDGHSHSWLSLEELFMYDYEQITKHRGMFEGKNLELARRQSVGLSIGHIPHSSWTNAPGAETLQWESYRQSIGGTYFMFLHKLARQALLDNRPFGDFRIVFWFDN